MSRPAFDPKTLALAGTGSGRASCSRRHIGAWRQGRYMTPAARLKSLSPARRRLVQLMQDHSFCRIEDLAIRNGEPVVDPLPTLVREVKFGGENGPRPEAGATDFALKSQVVELFREFDALGDGTIACIVVKHGLPFSMNVAFAA